MKYCEDCGTRFSCNACPNCYEELYINDYQMPEHPIPVSKEWRDKVEQQREEVDNRKEFLDKYMGRWPKREE